MRKVSRRQRRSAGRAVRRPRLDVSAFIGQWVAFHPKTYKAIGHGASLEEARRSTPNLAGLEPLLYFVPESDAYYSVRRCIQYFTVAFKRRKALMDIRRAR